MVEHICKKCGKKFDKKSTYVYHINRKISCISDQNRIEMLENRIEELEQMMKTLLKYNKKSGEAGSQSDQKT